MAELLLGDAVETEHCRCWLLDADQGRREIRMEWNDGKMKDRDLKLKMRMKSG